MDEPFLKRICIAGSVVSLALIFVLCSLLQPLETGICSLSPEHIGKTVSVEGEVADISNFTDGSLFFTLSRDGCEVKVVMWKDAVSAMSIMGSDAGSIKANSTVKVSGDVEVYRGSLQIVVSRPSVEVL
jgi:exonuclease VII large subunit